MKTALYLAPGLALTVYMLIRAELNSRQRQVYLLKPLSTLLVIAAGLASFREPSWNPVYNTGLLVGLVLSLGGDIALMFDRKRGAFMVGLALFLGAHIAYGVIFALLGRFSPWDGLSAAVLLAAALVFYRLIQPGLGSIEVPVIVYMIVISLMVNRAFATLASPELSLSQGLMVASGASLFYLSDVILAANRFWRPWKYNRVGLVLYFAGQYLIALAASYFV